MSISVFSKLIYFSVFLLQCRSACLPRIFAFHFRNMSFVTCSKKCFKFVLCTFSNIGLFQEKIKQGSGLRRWDFQKRRKTSKGDKKKYWNFQYPWFLVLEYSRGVVNTTSHYRNSRNEVLFCPELLRLK